MRIMLILRCLVAVLLLAAALPSVAAAQTNSGLDQYQEAPPGTDGSDPNDPSGTPSDPATAGDSGVAGISGSGGSTGTGSSSANLTEAQAAAAGETAKGQLPATGFDQTAGLAIVGGLLLTAGLFMRRRLEAH